MREAGELGEGVVIGRRENLEALREDVRQRCGVVSGAAPADRPEAWAGMGIGNRLSYALGTRLPWLSLWKEPSRV